MGWNQNFRDATAHSFSVPVNWWLECISLIPYLHFNFNLNAVLIQYERNIVWLGFQQWYAFRSDWGDRTERVGVWQRSTFLRIKTAEFSSHQTLYFFIKHSFGCSSKIETLTRQLSVRKDLSWKIFFAHCSNLKKNIFSWCFQCCQQLYLLPCMWK